MNSPNLPVPPAWMAEGVCAQTDPDAFFPEKGVPANAAKAVCADCPVREMCLQYALENDERYGIWGGMSEHQRRKLRKGRRVPREQRSDPRSLDLRHTVAAMTRDGLSATEIGRQLRISPRTVIRYRADERLQEAS